MGNRFSRRWLTRFVTLCLLLILLCFIGHFLADLTGVSLDTVVSLDLHGNFIQDVPTGLLIVFMASAVILLIPIRPSHWSKPPTPPPPIYPF